MQHAALVRSHIIGAMPFKGTIEQKKTRNNVPIPKTIIAATTKKTIALYENCYTSVSLTGVSPVTDTQIRQNWRIFQAIICARAWNLLYACLNRQSLPLAASNLFYMP